MPHAELDRIDGSSSRGSVQIRANRGQQDARRPTRGQARQQPMHGARDAMRQQISAGAPARISGDCLCRFMRQAGTERLMQRGDFAFRHHLRGRSIQPRFKPRRAKQGARRILALRRAQRFRKPRDGVGPNPAQGEMCPAIHALFRSRH